MSQPTDPNIPQEPWSPASGGQPYPPQPPFEEPAAAPYGQVGGAPYGQPVPYGQPGGYPYGQAQRFGAAPRTNTLAIVSLVASVLGIGLVGIICGHIARGQIRRTGEGGDGLALAGLIIGYVITAVELVFVLFLVGAIVAFQAGQYG